MEIEFEGRYDKDTVFRAVRLANKPSRRNAFIRIGSACLIAILFLAYSIALLNKGELSSLDILRSGRLLLTVPIV